ncbi:MAG TPA: hypothetical protein EYP88_00170 [Anaerolineales bacterium]|nr:hypothetical protein [Anaerolineales bacterium]
MEALLLDPNVVYLLIVGGLLLAFMAVLAPGTGLLELGALFTLILAGWGVFHLQVNYWALVILFVGVFPPLWITLKTKKTYTLVISVFSLILGSAYLLKGETWYTLEINPGLALVVSIIAGGWFWIVIQKTFDTTEMPPIHDLNALIGGIGEAKSNIHEEGSVQVNGELWTARSAVPIQAGSQVRVIDREGFILTVEEVE